MFRPAASRWIAAPPAHPDTCLPEGHADSVGGTVEEPRLMLSVVVAVLLGIGFVYFGVRAVLIMRDRPDDAGEFLRRWFGRDR